MLARSLRSLVKDSAAPCACFCRDAYSTTPPSYATRSNSLYPCPPPFILYADVPYCGNSRRGKRRHEERRACEVLVSLLVLGCNHAYLGFTRCCPARAVFGTPLNDEQRAFVKEMRARVESFRRLVGQGPSLCGGKLAGAEASLDTLARSLVNLDFIPYSRFSRRTRTSTDSTRGSCQHWGFPTFCCK